VFRRVHFHGEKSRYIIQLSQLHQYKHRHVAAADQSRAARLIAACQYRTEPNQTNIEQT